MSDESHHEQRDCRLSLLTRPLYHRRGRRPPLVEGLQLPSDIRPHRRWFPTRPRRFAIFLIVRLSPLPLARIPAVSPGAQQILHVSARVLGADRSFGVASGAGRPHRGNAKERAEDHCDEDSRLCHAAYAQENVALLDPAAIHQQPSPSGIGHPMDHQSPEVLNAPKLRGAALPVSCFRSSPNQNGRRHSGWN